MVAKDDIMTEDKLKIVLMPLCRSDRQKVVNDVSALYTAGLTYRCAVNAYFNTRLILLNIPLYLREELITDGQDSEWCLRFSEYILPLISKERMN